MKDYSPEDIHFSMDTVYWNRLIFAPLNHVKNFICLVAKHYIYRQRFLLKPLSITEFRYLIEKLKSYERYYALSKGKLKMHNLKWNSVNRNDS